MRDPLAGLPQAKFPGKIHFIESPEAFKEHLPTLRNEALIGFDTETRPSFRRGERYRPALIQLACSRCAYIIRLRLLGGVTDELAALIESSSPIKAGIGLAQDISSLSDWRLLTPSRDGLLDLVPLAHKLGFARPNLRALAAELLGLRVSKKARLTNWDAPRLTEAQIQYAAADAWISRELALKLQNLAIQNEVSKNNKSNCHSHHETL